MALSKDDVDYIRHAYEEGIKRGMTLATSDRLVDRLEGAIGYTVAHVEKYSPDQTAWATQKFAEEQSWRRGAKIDVAHMIRRMRSGPVKLSGCDFARYFPKGGEEGEIVAVGNQFVNGGLDNLIALWMGAAASGTTGRPLLENGASTQGVCGVGTGTTAPAYADTALISDNSASAYYQSFDASSLATSATHGQIVGTSTFGSANANFAWNEWCWATGAGSVTAGTTLSATANKPFATASTAAMVNHKTNVNLGTKASGSSWVFSTTFTIS